MEAEAALYRQQAQKEKADMERAWRSHVAQVEREKVEIEKRAGIALREQKASDARMRMIAVAEAAKAGERKGRHGVSASPPRRGDSPALPERRAPPTASASVASTAASLASSSPVQVRCTIL